MLIETAKIILSIETIDLVLRLHSSKVIGIEVIYGQAEIAVAKSEPFETYGIVIKVEIGALVLARVEYLHTVVTQMFLTKDRAEEIVGRVGQFHVVMLTEELVENIVLRHEIVPKIYELDTDMFLHNFIFVLRIYQGSTFIAKRGQQRMSRCNKRNL